MYKDLEKLVVVWLSHLDLVDVDAQSKIQFEKLNGKLLLIDYLFGNSMD